MNNFRPEEHHEAQSDRRHSRCRGREPVADRLWRQHTDRIVKLVERAKCSGGCLIERRRGCRCIGLGRSGCRLRICRLRGVCCQGLGRCGLVLGRRRRSRFRVAGIS